MAGSIVVDIKENKDGTYHILSFREDYDQRIRKYCLNPSCTTFGLITSEKVTERFLKRNPEFVLTKREVVVEDKVMDIITMNEEIAKIKIRADEGDSKSSLLLGQMYEEGNVAGQSLDMALKYYQMSSEPEAKENAKKLIKVYSLFRDVCSICIEKFNVNKDFCSTFCGHSFHLSCLMDVMKTQDTCPICRKKLEFKCSRSIEGRRIEEEPRRRIDIPEEEEESDTDEEEDQELKENMEVINEAIEALKSFALNVENRNLGEQIHGRVVELHSMIRGNARFMNGYHSNPNRVISGMDRSIGEINELRHFLTQNHLSGATIVNQRRLNEWITRIKNSINEIKTEAERNR
jgi:hypothetical protein